MIFALIIVLVGAVVLAAWARLLATQSLYPDNAAESQKRRIAIANGRAMARQFLLQSMPTGQSLLSSNYLANGWGGFQVFTLRSGFWTETNLSSGNPFNPFGASAFAVTNWAWISSSITNEEYYTYRVRSRSPLFAGYPLVVHNPSTSTNTNVAGNSFGAASAIFWTNVVGFPGFPTIPFASGTNTNSYAGTFSAPTNTFGAVDLPPANVTPTNLVTNSGIASADLQINSTSTNAYLRFVVPATTNIVDVSGTNAVTNSHIVTGLILVGSALTNTVHIVANTTNQNRILLSGNSNTQRFYVNKAAGNLTLSATNYTNGSWWLGLSLSATPLTVQTATNGVINIRGGVRTDSSITVSPSSGTFTSVLETTPGDTEAIADRILWLEEVRTQ